ncbi:hypothetical protein G6F42_028974 [Rhizopus arrhizus]|nr:hypothetical protein G6F42_028974 [Rhizopus arrhizus]
MSNIYRYERSEEECYSYTASVRIGILDILLKSLGKEVPSPTIAEFLLGYDVQDPTIKSIQQSSIATDKRARLASNINPNTSGPGRKVLPVDLQAVCS